MTKHSLATVILAAGHGARMRSQTPKVLHEIAGRSMLGHVMAAAAELTPERKAVVIGDHAPGVGDAARAIDPDIVVGVQAPPRGTGDAVMKSAPALEGFEGVVLVLYADTPFVSSETMRRLAGEVEAGAHVAVLGFRPADPGAYGRLKRGDDDALEAIVEAKDASPEELKIGLVNSGVMAFDAAFLRRGLPQLTDDNAKREFYLTDLVAIARAENGRAAIVEASPDEVMGVNSRVELAAAEAAYQEARRADVMRAGVTLIDPGTVYFSHDTKIETDVIIEPGVYFGPGVAIASGARVKAYSHLEGCHVGAGAQVGPFARLRPGTDLGAEVKIGNFVEVKNARLEAGAKASHLSYIGDARVGAEANVGAGVITCNYDGYAKHQTDIGAGAFVGSNSALVAPVAVGEGAYVGSGSVITRNVPDDALSVARGRQRDIPGWAAKARDARKKP
ncbi:MAG: bifunctional UDP-N-acetylglucosamine diphosphorylase/glucosamine-1-phosphate N-acetyltransferase GlmU [Pseudomonadota bacterium]